MRDETAKSSHSRRKVQAILRQSALYEKCQVADPFSVQWLLLERKFNLQKPRRDQGEAEAVVQAVEIGASLVLTDDALGRRWAAGRHIECHGTLWILRELRQFGALAALRPLVRQIRKSNRWLPEAEISNLLREFGEWHTYIWRMRCAGWVTSFRFSAPISHNLHLRTVVC